jgi:hypothetical protein
MDRSGQCFESFHLRNYITVPNNVDDDDDDDNDLRGLTRHTSSNFGPETAYPD